MMNRFYLFIIVFSIFCLNTFSQNTVNQFNSKGERDGYWSKNYPGTSQKMYEGTFKNGKEIGVFKTYCENCGTQPSVIRTFNNDGSVWVQYYTVKGKLVSEGKMINQKREGEWIIYQKKSNKILNKENYSNGIQEGKQITYYPDETIAEELNYKNGKKDGENLYYGVNGKLTKKLFYENDELEGKAFYYDASGQVTIEGNYKEGKKHGLWKYFKNGKLTLEETYPKPQKRG